MKRLLLSLSLILPSFALAAPFAVSPNAPAGVTQCGVYLDSAAKVVVPVTPVGTANDCAFDLANVATGAHTVSITYMTTNDPIWGTQESPKSAPLTFTRPAAPNAPATAPALQVGP